MEAVLKNLTVLQWPTKSSPFLQLFNTVPHLTVHYSQKDQSACHCIMCDTFVVTFKTYLEHIAQAFIYCVLLTQWIFTKGNLFAVSWRAAHSIRCVTVYKKHKQQLLFPSNHYRGTRTVTMTIRPIQSAVQTVHTTLFSQFWTLNPLRWTSEIKIMLSIYLVTLISFTLF